MALRSPAVDSPGLVRAALEGRRTSLGEVTFQIFLLITLLAALLVLAVLLVDVAAGALPVFAERGWDFIASPLSLDPDSAGVRTAVLGSLGLTAVVVVVSFPIGIGAAIYLAEYAPDNRFTRFVDTNIRNLAGVPSIVYGLLALGLFVPLVAAVGLGGPPGVDGRNLIAGGLALAVLVLPIVIITSSEALRAVPAELRQAGYAVGATQWEVIRHHVLPAAAPGILTGTVLTLARAFGETAPLLLVGVTTGYFQAAAGAGVMERITGSYTALPVTVLSWSRQPGGGFQEHLAPAAIVVLLAVLLGANAAAIVLRNRHDKRW
ncbi:MAG TPA: phosphate ABC transporter permease PstA [Acidimicrobiia bacterium]|nr:phosphate ABC transporter permease PstA [Acidimicrobiia bacterium]